MTITPLWDAYGWPARATHDVALFEGPQSVSVRFSKPILFVPRHLADAPGAPLWLTHRRGCALIYSLRSGRLQVYLDRTRRRGGRSTIYNVSPQPNLLLTVLREHVNGVGGSDDPAETTASEIADLVVAKAIAAGVPAPRLDAPPLLRLGSAVYPLLRHCLAPSVRWPEVLPSAITPALRAGSARDAASKAFGTKCTRPVISAVARSLRVRNGEEGPPAWVSFVPLALAFVAKPLLEPDEIRRVLDAPSTDQERGDRLSRDSLPVLRRTLAAFSTPRRLHLLEQAAALDHGVTILTDTARMLEHLGTSWLPRVRPRDLVELHDLVVDAYDAVAWADKQLTMFPKELEALDGREIPPDLRLVVPRSVHQLRDWGRAMHNCIGSYAPAAYAGRTWLLGVEKGASLHYNIEIDPRSGLRQFLGPSNAPADDMDVRRVGAVLRRAGLLTGRVAPRHGPELPTPPRRCGWVDEEPF